MLCTRQQEIGLECLQPSLEGTVNVLQKNMLNGKGICKITFYLSSPVAKATILSAV